MNFVYICLQTVFRYIVNLLALLGDVRLVLFQVGNDPGISVSFLSVIFSGLVVAFFIRLFAKVGGIS